MTAGPLLVPNLGAEEAEGEDAEKLLREPRVRTAARLWRWIFAEPAEVATRIDSWRWNAWPEALGQGRESAAFDWLADPEPCIPWLGTTAAARAAQAAGRRCGSAPPEVVARVHDKAFAARAAEDLGLVPPSLRGTTRVFEPGELEAAETFVERLRGEISGWPDWTRGRFTLKPRRGTSGRGRFDGDVSQLDPERVRAALPRLIARGGAVLEPWLSRSGDLSVQFRVEEAGDVTLLGSLALSTHGAGGYRGHRGEVDSRGRVFSGHERDEALRGAAAQIAVAARDAGFFGPAGVDALCFELPGEPGGEPVLRPVVELNARFTMGTVVLGLVRRLLAQVRSELDLRPGERRAFRFEMDAPAEGWDAACEIAGPGAILFPLFVAQELGQDGSGPTDPLRPAILFSRASADCAGGT